LSAHLKEQALLPVSDALRRGHTVTAGHDAVIITASATKLSAIKDSVEVADSDRWLRQSVQLGG
jgi:hypothetical protein